MSRMPRRPSHTRLTALELARKKKAPPPDQPQILAEEEWLEQFKFWAAEGLYADEPESRPAILAMERAIQEALERNDPPFLPPDHYMTDTVDANRRQCWRSSRKYPGLDAPFDKLLNLSERAFLARKQTILNGSQ